MSTMGNYKAVVNQSHGWSGSQKTPRYFPRIIYRFCLYQALIWEKRHLFGMLTLTSIRLKSDEKLIVALIYY